MKPWYYFEHNTHHGIFKDQGEFISIRTAPSLEYGEHKIDWVYWGKDANFPVSRKANWFGKPTRRATKKEIQYFKQRYIMAVLQNEVHFSEE